MRAALHVGSASPWLGAGETKAVEEGEPTLSWRRPVLRLSRPRTAGLTAEAPRVLRPSAWARVPPSAALVLTPWTSLWTAVVGLLRPPSGEQTPVRPSSALCSLLVLASGEARKGPRPSGLWPGSRENAWCSAWLCICSRKGSVLPSQGSRSFFHFCSTFKNCLDEAERQRTGLARAKLRVRSQQGEHQGHQTRRM